MAEKKAKSNGRLTYPVADYRCVDCPVCGGDPQAVRVDRSRDQLTFRPYCGHDAAQVAQAFQADGRTDRILAELVGSATGDHPGETTAETLAALLDLHKADLYVAGARINGRGSAASADLYLSDGTTVTFETLSDFANTTRLAVQLAACAGVVPKLDKQGALQALTLLREVAEHHEATTLDDLAYDWGASWLQAAEVWDFDVNSQSERWGAWQELERRNPDPRDRYADPPPRLAYRDVQCWRYVRTSWFFHYARSQDPRAGGNAQIAARMERVGWIRRGQRGRMKATDPATGRHLWQSLFLVPPDWESPPDEGAR